MPKRKSNDQKSMEAFEQMVREGTAEKIGEGYRLFTNLPFETHEKIAQAFANRCSKTFNELDEADQVRKESWRRKNRDKPPLRVRCAFV